MDEDFDTVEGMAALRRVMDEQMELAPGKLTPEQKEAADGYRKALIKVLLLSVGMVCSLPVSMHGWIYRNCGNHRFADPMTCLSSSNRAGARLNVIQKTLDAVCHQHIFAGVGSAFRRAR